jgi:predicted DNA-binding protein with PD1-like motif
MQIFTGNKVGRVFFIRIEEGEDVSECVKKFIEETKIKNGYAATAIGTLGSSVTHYITTTDYPSSFNFDRLKDKPIELSSIDGLIVDGKAHFHAVISTPERVYSGHLEPGCKALYAFEMAIVEVEGLDNITRKLNKHEKPQIEYK